MPKGRVRIREVPYKVVRKDALGNDMVTYDTAYGPGRPEILPTTRLEVNPDLDREELEDEYRLGQVADFLDDDYQRLAAAGAIIGVDKKTTELIQNQALAEEEGYGNKTVEELEAWIREDRPTVNAVVEASGGDHETATKLLEAESRAQDGDPRKGVVDGLMHVMAQA